MSNINWDEAPEFGVRRSIKKNRWLRESKEMIEEYHNDAGWFTFQNQCFARRIWVEAELHPETVIKNKDRTELKYQKSDTNDAVNAPSHYSLFENVEAIQLLASSMTEVEFRGYCFGNMLKYRARVGGKDDVNQEIGKANKYKELFAKYKNLCRTTSLFGQ